MNKSEFLTIISEKLSVLQDSEISDIVEEYRQHIDIKVSEGMTEEAAIHTLGDINELVAGILEAYHVKSGYMMSGEQNQKGMAGSSAGYSKDGILDKFKRFFENHFKDNNIDDKKVKTKPVYVITMVLKWLWDILLIFLTVSASLSMLFLIFIFGVCVVLLVQGYSLAGIMLVLLGGVLITGAATLFLCKIFKENPVKDLLANRKR